MCEYVNFEYVNFELNINIMRHRRFWAAKIVGFALLFVIAAGLFSWVVMALWNGVLVPSVSGVKVISWVQALGILVLSKILFGGFRGRGGWRRGRGGFWNKEMREKWSTMTPEEKNRMRQEWRDRCRTWGKENV